MDDVAAAHAGDASSPVPVLVAGAVVRRRNDVLVVRRDDAAAERRWAVPTAVVRSGATLVESAVGAVADSTGLRGVAGAFLGWYESIPEDTAAAPHEVVMCFEVVLLGDEHPTPGADVTDAVWMPAWDVAELPLVDGLAELLSGQGVIDTLT